MDRDKLLVTLDQPSCAATPGCVPIDIFRLGGVSLEAANFLRADPSRRQVTLNEHEVVGEIKTAFDLGPIEEIDWRSGGSARVAKIDDRDFTIDGLNAIGTFLDNDFSGSIATFEFYSFVKAPLLDDLSRFGGLDVSLNIRLGTSDVYDFTRNFEAGLAWRPVSGVSIYGDFAKGARAPNPVELFSVGRSAERFYADPCAGDDAEVLVNCALDHPLGVSDGFVQTQFLSQLTQYGNPALEPEEITSYRIGASIAPMQWPLNWVGKLPGNLSISANWLDYKIDDMISGNSNILNDCYQSAAFSDAGCGENRLTGAPLIERDPITQQISHIDALLVNNGQMTWRGLDLEARYVVEPDGLGTVRKIWFSGVHTYTDRVSVQVPSSTSSQLVGTAPYPRHSSTLSGGVSLGDHIELAAYAFRRGAIVSTKEVDLDIVRAPALTTFDLSARYELSSRAIATIGVENLLDKDPPRLAFADSINTYAEYYDIIGRRISVSLKTAF